MQELELKEFKKRNSEICLIASENYPSQDVLDVSGSIFQCKYAEGFPSKRYYQGCEVVDEMEQKCIDKCLKLFNADKNIYLANVQPNSGASANMIVYNAILQPGDSVLAMDTSAGGHISHGHPKSFLAKYFSVHTYGVDDNGWLDYEAIEKQAMEVKPKLIVCGASNYSREIDFDRFKEIANKCGAYLMADIAHISLLVAKGLHKSPIGVADFITFTTHKQLAGPRGGCIIYKKEFDKQIRLSTIPSLFGGPLEHQIYAKLVCFEENLLIEAEIKAEKIIEFAKIFANTFKKLGLKLLTDGTDNHLMTLDFSDCGYSGKYIAEKLAEVGIITNCNAVPNDKRSFLETSGIRIGVPAIVTRGFKYADAVKLATVMGEYIYRLQYSMNDMEIVESKYYLKQTVKNLCECYDLCKIYPKYENETLTTA